MKSIVNASAVFGQGPVEAGSLGPRVLIVGRWAAGFRGRGTWGAHRRPRGIAIAARANGCAEVARLDATRNDFANQPLRYVSAVEGFVFLSAFLVGSIYTPLMFQRGMTYVRERLWKRARTLYRYHLMPLLFVFTVVTAIAQLTGSTALYNYLLVFFRNPGRALAASPLLAYQPPLLEK